MNCGEAANPSPGEKVPPKGAEVECGLKPDQTYNLKT